MAYQHLNVQEWLESQRLAGCPWASELLDLLDDQDEFNAMASALEEIWCKAPDIVNGSKLELHEHGLVADWACGRLDLLDEIEAIIDEHLHDIKAPNGVEIVDPDDKLRAAFESNRWLTHDL